MWTWIWNLFFKGDFQKCYFRRGGNRTPPDILQTLATPAGEEPTTPWARAATRTSNKAPCFPRTASWPATRPRPWVRSSFAEVESCGINLCRLFFFLNSRWMNFITELCVLWRAGSRERRHQLLLDVEHGPASVRRLRRGLQSFGYLGPSFELPLQSLAPRPRGRPAVAFSRRGMFLFNWTVSVLPSSWLKQTTSNKLKHWISKLHDEELFGLVNQLTSNSPFTWNPYMISYRNHYQKNFLFLYKRPARKVKHCSHLFPLKHTSYPYIVIDYGCEYMVFFFPLVSGNGFWFVHSPTCYFCH